LSERVLLIGTAMSGAESAEALARLARTSIPDSRKIVITTGKFDSGDIAARFNVEAGYPAAIAQLQTMASWAGADCRENRPFRDGYDLFCLRSVLAKYRDADYAILLRSGEIDGDWLKARSRLESSLHAVFPEHADGSCNVAFGLGAASDTFLDLAWDLYQSGAVFALEPYTLSAALTTAAEALAMYSECAGD
jgi:hypothetical protein